jgi:hypothetical protein
MIRPVRWRQTVPPPIGWATRYVCEPLFAVEPELEVTVRQGIDQALAGGQLPGPDAQTTQWQLRSSQPSVIQNNEMDQAHPLICSSGSPALQCAS